jgi:hypothetical protein
MRFSFLPLVALIAAFAFAPAASAAPIHRPMQNLSSPDAQDANAAKHAQTLEQITRMHRDSKDDAALAQERYYSSYGPATPRPAAAHDDGSPVLTIALGLGLIALVSGSVAVAVRTRRRAHRVRVAV